MSEQIALHSVFHMIYLVNMFRLCSDFSDNFQNVQNRIRLFRQCSECSDTVQNVQTFQTCSNSVQNLFRHVQTLFIQCSECLESVQNFQSMFRMFRICSDFSDNVQNMFRHSSESSDFSDMLKVWTDFEHSEHWLKILNILNIDWKFWTLSEKSEQCLNRFWTFWTLTENSEQILNILNIV
jgi:hypothetical protein